MCQPHRFPKICSFNCQLWLGIFSVAEWFEDNLPQPPTSFGSKCIYSHFCWDSLDLYYFLLSEIWNEMLLLCSHCKIVWKRQPGNKLVYFIFVIFGNHTIDRRLWNCCYWGQNNLLRIGADCETGSVLTSRSSVSGCCRLLVSLKFKHKYVFYLLIYL